MLNLCIMSFFRLPSDQNWKDAHYCSNEAPNTDELAARNKIEFLETRNHWIKVTTVALEIMLSIGLIAVGLIGLSSGLIPFSSATIPAVLITMGGSNLLFLISRFFYGIKETCCKSFGL